MESNEGVTAIFTIQGIAIIILNVLSITVFWRRRAALKRTRHLLVNLSVADTIVGIVEVIFSFLDAVGVIPLVAFSVSASVISLAIISVERLLATWKPVRHRNRPTKNYFIAIAIIWFLSVQFGVLHIFGNLLVTRVISSMCIALMLCTLLISYSAIWYLVVLQKGQVYGTDQETNQEGTENRRNRERNKKLTKTLSIVTALSLLAWIPTSVKMVALHAPEYREVHAVTDALMFGNSLVNPVVYILRMQEFREEVKRLLFKLCPLTG